MEPRVQRELRWLKAWAVASSVALAVLLLGAFGQPRQRFTEIDVERSIGPIYKGEPFGYAGGTRPGIIFFNDEGTENGGLTFSGKVGADGKYQASHHLSFDQFNQDQVLYFNYTDNNGTRRMGFTIADRADVDIMQMVKQRDSITAATPEGAARNAALQQWAQQRPGGRAMFAPRVYVGRDPARNAVVNLSDPEGRTRLRLVVDSLGTPAMEFLDAQGKVVSRLPQ
jgi:hypothetical protein